MKSLHAKLFIITAAHVLVFGTSSPAAGGEPPTIAPKPVAAVRNAALTYWQAFAEMPKLEEAESKVIAKPNQPLDAAEAKKIIFKYDRSIKLFKQATQMKECDWGLDLDLGPELSVSHAVKCMSMVKVLRLEARILAQDGDASGAVADLIAMFRAGRMVSQHQSPIICMLIQEAIESEAIATAAQLLPKFDEASLKALSNGIDTLPAAQSTKESFQVEKTMITGWLRRSLEASAAKNDIRSFLKKIFAMGDDESEKTDPDFDRVMNADQKTVLAWLDQLDSSFDELVALMGLPYAECKTGLAAFEKKVNERKATRFNPIESIATPALFGIREKGLRVEALHSMLRAAMEAQLHHPDEVRAHLVNIPDPLGDGPLECRDVPGGVELKSKQMLSNRPVMLIVGLKEK